MFSILFDIKYYQIARKTKFNQESTKIGSQSDQIMIKLTYWLTLKGFWINKISVEFNFVVRGGDNEKKK